VRKDDLFEVIRRNRSEAINLSTTLGQQKLLKLLGKAEADLTRRLNIVGRARGPSWQAETFTTEHMRVTLGQIREVTRGLTHGLGRLVLAQGDRAVDQSTEHLVDYLGRAERKFRGVGARTLKLKEAAILDQATSGTESTVLRRLMSSDADEDQPKKMGILDRYGVETVGAFEQQMQVGMLAERPWAEVRDSLVEESPFLQGSPRFWAERIVRTESMHAWNHASWQGMRAADQQLGDMVKILSSVFDDRTAADSYAEHGQIRRVEEPFATWYGLMMHPPDRPNDRAVVIPHRISWPIPASLTWRSGEEISARWAYEGRKGSPPPRPSPMTTVPLGQFGQVAGPAPDAAD